MSTMPKVSVVTTTYNDMDNLCRIMEEVRKQTYKNIEHIIVDGGSTDGTVEMLTRLSEEQPGAFRWISEPDDGIYDAINKGLKLCTGDIIGTCFDHFADETVLARMVEIMEREGTDGVHGDLCYMDGDRWCGSGTRVRDISGVAGCRDTRLCILEKKSMIRTDITGLIIGFPGIMNLWYEFYTKIK